ncbi:hypothetical protein DP939_04800 [Spongiactinospora rosea]|uniref:Uncharacterized protein n=2 Tax=Spongiactinospora rosea TaxID=2248750 RepID=A0A366M8X1_9ACTN|nr:hypothetical protein DP939_04800 [Spongiactinospora rosea]
MLGLGVAVYGRVAGPDSPHDAHNAHDAPAPPGTPGPDDRPVAAGGDAAGDRHSGARMKGVVYGSGKVVQVIGDQVIYER